MHARLMASCWILATPMMSTGADHDIIRMRDGSKILGHADWLNDGKLKVIQLDGKEINLRITAIENIVFAPVKKVESERPILESKGAPVVEYFAGDKKFPELPAGMTISYLAHSDRTVNRNSRPFSVTNRTLLFVGFVPDGPSPYLSLILDESEPDANIGGSISNSDFGTDGTVFGSKIVYDTGDGNAYADVSAQNCKWVVAVINCARVPSPEDTKVAGYRILQLAQWRQIALSQ